MPKRARTALARSELGTAEQLKPGLPFASPRSVQELKAQLGLRVGAMNSTSSGPFPAEADSLGHVLILAGVVGVLLLVFRRRNNYVQYPAAAPSGRYAGAPGTYGPGYGPAPMAARSRLRHRGAASLRIGCGRGCRGRRRTAPPFHWTAGRSSGGE